VPLEYSVYLPNRFNFRTHQPIHQQTALAREEEAQELALERGGGRKRDRGTKPLTGGEGALRTTTHERLAILRLAMYQKIKEIRYKKGCGGVAKTVYEDVCERDMYAWASFFI